MAPVGTSTKLGSRLLLFAGEDDRKPLADSLSRAPGDVAALHQDTCDLTHLGSPAATVTMIRQRGTETDYLVLADSPLVFDVGAEPQQRSRNTAEGYWVAHINPEAAEHALTGTVSSARGALLASDGAALLVTDFDQLTWQELLDLGYHEGPEGIINATRRHASTVAAAFHSSSRRWPDNGARSRHGRWRARVNVAA